MRLGFFGWIALAALLFPIPAVAQGAGSPAITAPAAGQSLLGQVPVNGSSDVPNFAEYELDFAYQNDTGATWFVIRKSSQPLSNDVLGVWDTTGISDGDYILRLRVTLVDGTHQDVTVSDLHVRNYTAQPTATLAPTPSPTAAVPVPTPILLAPSPSPTAVTPTAMVFPTPTPLPVNPAELTTGDILVSLQRGALVIAGLFLLVGFLLRLRKT